MEGNHRWKTTFGGRQPLVEDDLWWKTTYSERRKNQKIMIKRIKMNLMLSHTPHHTPLCGIFYCKILLFYKNGGVCKKLELNILKIKLAIAILSLRKHIWYFLHFEKFFSLMNIAITRPIFRIHSKNTFCMITAVAPIALRGTIWKTGILRNVWNIYKWYMESRKNWEIGRLRNMG